MEDLSEYYQQQPADPVDIQVVWICAGCCVLAVCSGQMMSKAH